MRMCMMAVITGWASNKFRTGQKTIIDSVSLSAAVAELFSLSSTRLFMRLLSKAFYVYLTTDKLRFLGCALVLSEHFVSFSN